MKTKIHDGVRWLVVMDRHMIGKDKNAIVSQHRTRPAAVAAAGPAGCENSLRVVSVREYLLTVKDED